MTNLVQVCNSQKATASKFLYNYGDCLDRCDESAVAMDFEIDKKHKSSKHILSPSFL